MAISNVLIDPINSYPVFRPNQVLTEAQLNGMIEYLDEQNRLTRVLLLGTGIVCGFEPVWKDATTDTPSGLYVSAGFGVTSDGYLIHEQDQQLNRYRLRDVPLAWFGYKSNQGLPDTFANVTELHYVQPGNTDPLDGTLPLTKDILKSKVLIYLLELNNQDNQGLCNNDCDGRNETRLFTLHKLLFSEADALSILATTYEVNNAGAADLQDKFYHKYFMPHLAVPRFGYEPDISGQGFSTRLDNITSYDIFRNRYAAILVKFIGELSVAVEQAHRIFSPVLTPGEAPPALTIANLSTKITAGNYDILEIQYLYDHLTDLTDAYVEFVETAFDLIADCNFHPKHFPNHLVIRKFSNSDPNNVNVGGDPELEPYSVFRTPYTQPPVYNENRNRLEEVRTLFNRLMLMSGGYTTPSVTGADVIKITPGKSFRAPLSERAMPYYYPGSLVNAWNPRRNRFNRAGKVYSYHRPPQGPDNAPYNDPLIFEMEGSDFFRIEGHIGHDLWATMSNLDTLRKQYNLPFNVIALKIGQEFNDEIFQFECENFECEKEELRDRYSLVRQQFDQEVLDKLSPQDGKELSNASFSNTMPENLDQFNYKAFSDIYALFEIRKINVGPVFVTANFPDFTIGFLPPEAKLPFQQVNDCYQRLLDKIEETKNRHLFHYFAQTYPGLDHKGGVPVGGTFILVYVEPEEIPSKINQLIGVLANQNAAIVVQESRIIVADFYLPYSCCSNCPPICYVVARPKPVFAVTPNVFCSGDDDETELTVVAHPGGGVISGAGYHFHDGKHWFRPSEAGTPDENNQIKLYYSIDGAMAETLIALVPPKNAGFTLKLASGQTVDDLRICEGEGPLTLDAIETGGQFFIAQNGQPEIPLNGNIYDSHLVEVNPGVPVQVIIRHVVEGDYCDAEELKTLTIDPKPDPTFSFEGNQTQVCQDVNRVQLNPVIPGGGFKAFVEGVEVTIGAISKDQGNSFFVPSAINLAPGQNAIVIIEHLITTQAGCTDRTELPITVTAKPNPNFTIGSNLKQICQTAAPVNLKAVTSGGTYKAFAQGNEKTGAILGNQQFNPKAIELQGNTPVEVTITYEVSAGNICTATHSETVLVTPPPVAAFNAALAVSNNPDAESILVNISNIKPENAAKYTWMTTPGQSKPANFPTNNSNNFTVEYKLNADLMPISLQLVVENGGCPSLPVTKKLSPFIQRFELIGIVTNAGGGVQPIELGIIEDGAQYTFGQLEGAIAFNIRAVPFPFEVSKVSLELNDDQGITTTNTSSTKKNYRLIEGTTSPVPVKQGNFIVKATPITQSGEPGTGKTVHFSIVIDDEFIRQPEPPTEPSEEAIAFMRKRDNTYRKEIEKLKSNDALAKTAGFQQTEVFTKFQGTSEELNERYEKTVKTLLADADSVKKGSAGHKQVLQLMSLTTQYFMDRQVFMATKVLPPAALKVLQGQLAALKKAGVKPDELKTTWNGTALKKQLSAPSVDAILKLLK